MEDKSWGWDLRSGGDGGSEASVERGGIGELSRALVVVLHEYTVSVDQYQVFQI